jgi:hypothetical protein
VVDKHTYSGNYFKRVTTQKAETVVLHTPLPPFVLFEYTLNGNKMQTF